VIVDVHTHTPTHRDSIPADEARSMSGWNNAGAVPTTHTWASFADHTSVADVTIVFNIAVEDPERDTGLAGDPTAVNTSTAEFVASDPRRRIGFMSVDPKLPGFLDEVRRSMEAGLVGIKLGANYQRFDPLSAEALALYGFAQDHALPILFHQGASPIPAAPLAYSHPLVTDEIAIRYPDLRIVMAHLGHPFTREAVATVRKHPNVYADVSALPARPWTLYEGLLFAQEWGAGGKLLFGSDFPVMTPAAAIGALRNVNAVVEGTAMPRVSEGMIEDIIHADALGALGLELPA